MWEGESVGVRVRVSVRGGWEGESVRVSVRGGVRMGVGGRVCGGEGEGECERGGWEGECVSVRGAYSQRAARLRVAADAMHAA